VANVDLVSSALKTEQAVLGPPSTSYAPLSSGSDSTAFLLAQGLETSTIENKELRKQRDRLQISLDQTIQKYMDLEHRVVSMEEQDLHRMKQADVVAKRVLDGSVLFNYNSFLHITDQTNLMDFLNIHDIDAHSIDA
jgi:hypothetical protein